MLGGLPPLAAVPLKVEVVALDSHAVTAEIEVLCLLVTQLVVRQILVVEVAEVLMVLLVDQTHKIEFLDQVVKV